MNKFFVFCVIFFQTYIFGLSESLSQPSLGDFCQSLKLSKQAFSKKTLISVRSVPEKLKEAIKCLEYVTTVPIIAPSDISYFKDDIPLIGVPFGNKYRYFIGMAANRKCSSYKCIFGGFGGELITSDTLDPTKQYNLSIDLYARSGRSTRQGGYITLSKKIRGFYLPSFCFSSCSDAQIIWQQDKYQYYVALSSSNGLKEMVKFANSVIANQP